MATNKMLLFKPNEFENFFEFIHAYGKKGTKVSFEANLHEACKNLLEAKEKDPTLPGTIVYNPNVNELAGYSIKIDLDLLRL
jgi:hypothetical protein